MRIARRACLGLLVFLAFAATAPAFARDDASAYFRAGRIVELAIELSAESAAALRQDPRAYVRCTLREGDRIVSETAGIKLKGAAGSFREFDDRRMAAQRSRADDGDAERRRRAMMARTGARYVVMEPGRDWLLDMARALGSARPSRLAS